QLRILKFLAPRVEEPALRAGWRAVGERLLIDPAVDEGREVVARRPGARGEFLAEQIIPGGKRLESGLPVAIKFVAQDIEIILPAADRKLRAPPILHALVFDEPPRLEAADLVRAGAERRIEGRFVEFAGGVIGAGEDRQAGDEQGNVARTTRRKAGHDHGIAFRLGAEKIAHELLDQWMPLRL